MLPILAAKCYACHGPDESKRKAGLRLDEKEAAFSALAEGGPLDPLAPHDEGAVANWLSGGAAGHGGTVEFTLASDDPDDLTLRQARWLGSADRVFYSPGVPAAVLTRARADAVQRELGSEPPAPADGLTVIIRRG